MCLKIDSNQLPDFPFYDLKPVCRIRQPALSAEQIELLEQILSEIRTREEDQQYNTKLRKYGVKKLLLDLGGDPCKGTYKRAYSTSYLSQVALLSSPRNTLYPSLYAREIEREMRIHQKLQYGPHIPKIYDQFEVKGERYASIQENVGPTLYDAYLNPKNPQKGRLYLDDIERIVKRQLEALSHLHNLGVIHGDGKPENWSQEGDLFDFNLSEEIGDKETERFKFSSFFRPPETTLYSRSTLGSDLWALGCTLFQLCAKKPFIGVFDNKEKPLQTLINMMHGYQQRLEISFHRRICPECFENGRLKPATTPPLPPFQEDLSFLKGYPKGELFLDLLSQMLTFSPTERITAKKALEHPFFTSPFSTDRSVKIAINGRNSGVLRIFSPQGYFLKEINFADCPNFSCFHLPRFPHPYYFELHFPQIGAIYACHTALDADGLRLSINTDTYSVNGIGCLRIL